MYIKAFTSFQYQFLARTIRDQWQIQRALVRSRSIQVLDQFWAEHTDDFQAYVGDLVRFLFIFLNPFVNIIHSAIYIAFLTALRSLSLT